MKKKIKFTAAFEIEKKTVREDYEFGKMTPENESVIGLVEQSK